MRAYAVSARLAADGPDGAEKSRGLVVVALKQGRVALE
jgi:hypothetical protein